MRQLVIPSPNMASFNCQEMNPQDVIAEFEKRKAENSTARPVSRNEVYNYRRDRLNANMTDDMRFFLIYFPLVIAEVAWDYADSIVNISRTAKSPETKRLVRDIIQLREDYQYRRKKLMGCEDQWFDTEQDLMERFQDDASSFFSASFNEYKQFVLDNNQNVSDALSDSLSCMYIIGVVLDSLINYAKEELKEVVKIIHYTGKTDPKAVISDETLKMYESVKRVLKDYPISKEAKKVYDMDVEFITEHIINIKKKSLEPKKPRTKKPFRDMETIQKEIEQKYEQFAVERSLEKQENLAAGVRARKLSIELERLLAEYRRASIKRAEDIKVMRRANRNEQSN